ncbi:MAG: hypothetical protein JXI43_13435 [Tissierellales bacterium]|nr:hypothetical protein [Tissierellales bacterium]
MKKFTTIFLVILILCCSKEGTEPNSTKNGSEPDSTKNGTEPDSTADKCLNINGNVYKIMESGQFLSPNTCIQIDYSDDSIKTATDETGRFNFSLPDTITSINIVIQERDFFRLDTLITDFNNPLNFYISQIIYYFPTVDAAKWLYNVFYSTQATWKLTKYKGIESWEILTFSDSSKTGLIKCTFNGSKYNLEWRETAFDTVSVDYANCGKTYNFKLDNGYFICTRSTMAECETIFDHLVSIYAQYPIVIGFPPNSAATILIDNSIMQGRIPQRYEIQRDIGIVTFQGASDHIWGGESIRYELID